MGEAITDTGPVLHLHEIGWSESLRIKVWGADWYPSERQVGFESLINIRPRQQNFTMEIQDPALRSHVEVIVRRLLEVA